MNVREIEMRGSPYECGLAHGKNAADLIKICIANYADYIRNDNGMSWNEAQRTAKSCYEEKIRAFQPELLEEMHGIADGAAVGYEEILAINCRSELRAMAGDPPAECTTVAVLGTRSADGHTYTGQNWDNNTAQRECMVILKIYQNGKPEVMLFTEAGFVGGKGLNGEGIGLLLNALFVGSETDAIPLHIKMRAALNCGNISDAYSAAARENTGSGGNLMLGSDGAVICEELTLHEVDGLLPANGVLAHTNHILSPRMQHIPDRYRVNGSSFLRLERAQELLRVSAAPDKAYMYRILGDKVGYPHSIATYALEEVEYKKQYSTNYSIVFDHTERAAYFCAGYPDPENYKRYAL